MKKIGLIVSGFALLAFAACKSSTTETLKAEKRKTFFDTGGMDTATKPGDDFFTYANGGWIKATKIPDDQSGWGSFITLNEENQKKMKAILEEASTNNNAAKGSTEQKVGDYYASGMDTVAIENKGYEPLKPLMQKIAAVKDYKELVNILAQGYADGEGDLFGFYIGPDDKNSTKNIAALYQNGLTLPEKDYYTKNDPTTVEQRAKMVEYATKLFMMTGTDSLTASKKGADVLDRKSVV